MKKLIGCLLIIIGLGIPALASDVDSLRVVLQYEEAQDARLDVLFQLSSKVLLAEGDEFDRLATEGINIAMKVKDHDMLGDFYYLMAYRNKCREEYSASFRHFYWALQAYQQSENAQGQAYCWEHLGAFYVVQDKYDLAQEAFDQAEELLFSIDGWQAIANLQHRQGLLAQDQKRFDEALQYFQLALGFYLKENNHLKISGTQERIATIYLENGELEQAKSYLDLATNSLRTLPADKTWRSRASIQNNQAYLAELNGEHAAALALSQAALTTALPHHDPLKRQLLNNAAIRAITLDQHDKAIAYLEEALTIPDPKDAEEVFQTYSIAVELYTKLENFKRALALEQDRNSLEVSQQQAQLAQAEIHQSAQLQLAQAQMEIEEAMQARIQERQLWWLAIAFILLLAGIGVFIMYRKAMKHKAKAAANATHWPELNQRMADLEDALHLLG